jgi:hypothetical protein
MYVFITIKSDGLTAGNTKNNRIHRIHRNVAVFTAGNNCELDPDQNVFLAGIAAKITAGNADILRSLQLKYINMYNFEHSRKHIT